MEASIQFIQMALENIWFYGAVFLFVLTILVFVHEWGHFIVARMCGVKVEVFSIGFGKELWGFTAKNGTRWKFSMLPLGGYVKMFGDSDPASSGRDDSVEYTDDDRKVAFFTQPIWKRAAIVFAGPAVNFIFAIMLLAGLFLYNGKVDVAPIMTAVQVGSPAEQAGFKPHDRVLEINGRDTEKFGDITRAVSIALDTEMTFVVDRDGKEVELLVTPERIEIEGVFDQEIGRIGVLGPSSGFAIKDILKINGKSLVEDDVNVRRELLEESLGKEIIISSKFDDEDVSFIASPSKAPNEGMSIEGDKLFNVLVLSSGDFRTHLELGPAAALSEGGVFTWRIVRDTLQAMGQFFTGTRSVKELGGVIRIASFAGDMAQQGMVQLIFFTALISINLGLINLFPIPLLDGGHLAMYAVEAVKGKPVSEKAQEYAFRVGLTFLVFLMVFANLNDLLQILL